MIKRLRDIAEKNIQSSSGDGLKYMRETSFNYVVIITFFIGLTATALSIYKSILINDMVLIIVDLFSIFIVFVLAFGSSILSYNFRLNSYMTLSLFLGVAFLMIEGPQSAGLIYFVAFNLLAAVFYGQKKLYMSFAVTIIILAALSLIIHLGLFPGSPIHRYTTIQFILIGINVIIISSLSIVLALMVNNLDRTIIHKEKLRKLLHDNNQNLLYAKKKAEESERLKSSFLANMSHEIRTPMNAILGFADLAMNQPDVTLEEVQKYIKTIYNSGEYLMNIIENILDASLLDSGQMKIVKAEVNIPALFSELEALFFTKVKDIRNVKLIFEFEEQNTSKKLITDESRLKQILINLINNALKFTKEGEIKVGNRFLRNNVEFFVRDSGIGIKTEDLSKIFDRFVKAHRDDTITKAKGAGLGLSISKGIVERLGGSISVQSVPGEGTIFHFTLPYE